MQKILVILIAGVLFLLIDCFCTLLVNQNSKIIDKQYKPKSISVGTGVGTNSNGSTTVVTTTNIESEQFILIVQNQNTEIISVLTSPNIYYAKKLGDSLKYKSYVGLFTKWVY